MLAVPNLPENSSRFSSLKQFEIKQLLDEGGYARVFKAITKDTCQLVALKIMELGKIGPKHMVNVEQEVALHWGLKSPYIVEMFGYFLEAGLLVLVLELAPKGNLRRLMRKRVLSDLETRKIFRQVSLGLEFLHEKGIVLRDLKPENVLLTNDFDAKICDFGWAMIPDGSEYSSDCAGTLPYLSPECLAKQQQTSKVDMWCLGIFLFEISHGHEPFEGNDEKEMIDLIASGPPRFSPCLPTEEIDLIKKLLSRKADERLSIQAVLSDNFFKPLFATGYTDSVIKISQRVAFAPKIENVPVDRTPNLKLRRKTVVLPPLHDRAVGPKENTVVRDIFSRRGTIQTGTVNLRELQENSVPLRATKLPSPPKMLPQNFVQSNRYFGPPAR